MTDQAVRDVLERLPTPPEVPEFFDAFWFKAEQHERQAARRWRRTSIALAVFIVTAGTAAGVFAVGRAGGATVVDRTISCPTANISHALLLGASVHRTAPLTLPGKFSFVPNLGRVGVQGVSGVVLAGAAGVAKGGYTLNRYVCHPAPKVPLVRTGLRQIADFAGPEGEGSSWTCSFGAVATIRLHVTLTAAGKPRAASLVLWSAGKARAFVDWTPARVRVWATPACQPR